MVLGPLVALSTHPIQYQAPLYRAIQQHCDIPVTAIYGSDFSVVGYHDAEFATTFAWDTDLLSGYDARFLSRVAEGGAATVEEVTGRGIEAMTRPLRPAAVLLTGYHGPFHRAAFRAARALRRPILFRAEATDTARDRHPLKGWMRDRYLSWFYRHCALLLPIGQRASEHYRRLAPGVPQVASPYCVDTAPFQPDESERERLRAETRHALGLADDRLAILFVGKLVSHKDPSVLVRAVKQLPTAVREMSSLLFLGEGSERGALEALISEAPPLDTRFLGFQNQGALSPFYHAADLLVLPSKGETWGLVVNEALHHGLPCVVSDRVGCVPDLIEPGQTGEVFEMGSVASLAQAIERALPLLGEPTVRALCRERISGYTVERAAEGIARAYHEAIRVGSV